MKYLVLKQIMQTSYMCQPVGMRTFLCNKKNKEIYQRLLEMKSSSKQEKEVEQIMIKMMVIIKTTRILNYPIEKNSI